MVSSTLQARTSGLLRLSRWKEHVPSTMPATLLGANMALGSRFESVGPDWHVPVIVAANVLAVTFAFMVNDIEDAPDDARDRARGALNAVASGAITPRDAWRASGVVAALALALFAWAGGVALAVGATTIGLGFLYSWRGVRLKAIPVVDLLAHLLMLGVLLFLAGYFTYDRSLGRIWLVAVGVGLLSAYGQLYNQLRDYDVDRAAGLRNTASILGWRATRRLMVVCLWGAVVSLAATPLLGLWPLWLVPVTLAMLPLTVIFRSRTDLRGTRTIDVSGRIQLSAMVLANVIMLLWFFETVIR
jgi:4-hydroxybenzoate polyprenyltransferase